MDAQAFWNVIGNYNQQTKMVQIGLFIFVIFCAYEDIILLVCGLYGITLLINEIRQFQRK